MWVTSAYVQKVNGDYINETAMSFANGCRQLGLHVETFEAESLKHVQLPREAVVHGYVGVVKRALAALGVSEVVPRVDGFPPAELLPHYGRRLWTSTLGALRVHEGHPVFIKPLHQVKAFTGHVRGGLLSGLAETGYLPDDFEVVCSDVVDFTSEYRLFVHDGLLVDARPYRGDFTVPVDFDVALQCVRDYKSAPVAYSLDLGVTRDGQTLVVEVNDAWALGGYGIAAVPYAQMVCSRWEQMVGLSGT